jgi:hypothetical protein
MRYVTGTQEDSRPIAHDDDPLRRMVARAHTLDVSFERYATHALIVALALAGAVVHLLS